MHSLYFSNISNSYYHFIYTGLGLGSGLISGSRCFSGSGSGSGSASGSGFDSGSGSGGEYLENRNKSYHLLLVLPTVNVI